jgi:hypothetical protein
MRTQKVVAEWFQSHGFPNAESTGSGRAGVDILGLIGFAVEVKARRDLNLTAWLRQAAKDARVGLPVVIHRPDGFGEASVSSWPVTLTLSDFTTLIHEAGYGTPTTT